MRRVVMLVLAAAVMVPAWVTAQTKADQDKLLAAIAGRWVISQVNGQAVRTDMGENSLTFAGATYKETAGGQVREEGTITVDPSKSPAWITLSIKTGESAGQVQPGLVIVKGDQMQLSLTTPGNATRPASMEAAELRVTLQRVK